MSAGETNTTRREVIAAGSAVASLAALGPDQAPAVLFLEGQNEVSLALHVNGVRHDLSLEPRVTLPDTHRERLNLCRTKKATALAAVDASFDIVSPRGASTISIHDLHVEPGRTPDVEHMSAAGELIVRTRIPAQSAYRASTYQKIGDRASYAFALASAAVALDIRSDLVRDARTAIGSHPALAGTRCRTESDRPEAG
jgi:FAD binding domain in molybdopterin dehydrogenase